MEASSSLYYTVHLSLNILFMIWYLTLMASMVLVVRFIVQVSQGMNLCKMSYQPKS